MLSRAAILSSVNQGGAYRDFLRSLDTPIVTIGNKIAEGIPFVSIQEKKAAKEATEAILYKGYEKIVFVCPPLERTEGNTYVHRQRLEGFLEALSNWRDKIKTGEAADAVSAMNVESVVIEQEK